MPRTTTWAWMKDEDSDEDRWMPESKCDYDEDDATVHAPPCMPFRDFMGDVVSDKVQTRMIEMFLPI